MSEITEYNEDIQRLFIQFLLSDHDLFARCQNIVNADAFSRKFRPTVDLLISHSKDYNTMPTLEQINAVGGLNFEEIKNITPDHQSWFMDEFETFCRHKAMETAIIESTDLLEKQDYGTVEQKIRGAMEVSLVKDLGLDYFENPKERLEWIKQQSGAVSTGWKGIDQKLYGGLNRGEITIFAGGSGAGKSLFLQNFGVNWSLAGLNVVYVSLELSEQLISMRLDGMVRVKYMNSGITTNDLRAFLREYEIQSGIKVDCLLVDYLDLMMPISGKISAENTFIKDKFVSEELRNLAQERELLMVTASQLNRSAVEEIEFDHHHIAGGISKIQTADNVVGIFTSNAMRERGRYQIQFMKTRSSSGVGSKVDLKFNPDTLRIEDLDEGDEDTLTLTTNNLVDQLKRSSSIKTEDSSASDVVEAGLQLRDFLKKKK